MQRILMIGNREKDSDAVSFPVVWSKNLDAVDQDGTGIPSS